MKTKIKAAILAGTFLVSAVLPVTVLAGRARRTGGEMTQRQTQTDQVRRGQRLRLRDGSCLYAAKTPSGTMEKKGNTYGPGDGTGNETPPHDGNGYGEPSQK